MQTDGVKKQLRRLWQLSVMCQLQSNDWTNCTDKRSSSVTGKQFFFKLPESCMNKEKMFLFLTEHVLFGNSDIPALLLLAFSHHHSIDRSCETKVCLCHREVFCSVHQTSWWVRAVSLDFTWDKTWIPFILFAQTDTDVTISSVLLQVNQTVPSLSWSASLSLEFMKKIVILPHNESMVKESTFCQINRSLQPSYNQQ